MAKVKKAIKALKKRISKKFRAKPKTKAKLAKKPAAGKKPAVRGKSRFQAPPSEWHPEYAPFGPQFGVGAAL